MAGGTARLYYSLAMLTTIPNLPSASFARRLAIWLSISAASIFIMAIIGAITRLTESGLSMVEWTPLIGILPPGSDAEWQQVFGLYQHSPEYQLKNAGMSLDEFKNIFFWEWLHRTWGHVVGLVYAAPLLWFAARGAFAKTQATRVLLPRLLFILFLGALQGVIGWYMVASGLVDQPDVSHYRLALHLGLAFVIYALQVWTVCDLVQARLAPTAFGLWHHGRLALGFIIITIIYGAFVAGLDAGFVYNTWPLMDGRFMPPEVTTIQPVWLNLFENTAMVQFIHRWVAIIASLLALTYAWRVRAAAPLHALWLGTLVLAQVILGVTTLLSHVHLHVATAHQAGALALLTVLLVTLHKRGAYLPRR